MRPITFLAAATVAATDRFAEIEATVNWHRIMGELRDRGAPSHDEEDPA